MEKRLFDIRKFTDGEGTFEAYVATWDTIDSFGTRFKKGAFRKTMQERLAKGDIKILWQHKIDEPIGYVLDAREDETGLLINGKLDIGVPRADQARLQMASGTINQMSFGFDIIKQQKAKDGFIDISEVRWWEASPVTFAANPETSIVNVRSAFMVKDNEIVTAPKEHFFSLVDDSVQQVGPLAYSLATRALELINSEFEKLGVGGEPGPHSLPDSADGSLSTGSGTPPFLQTNATDFDETFDLQEFSSRGFAIMDALFETLMDIVYGWHEEPIDIVTASDAAFEGAHAKFVEWANELVSRGVRAKDPRSNALAEATYTFIDGRALADVAQDSPLSKDELSLLLKGNILPLEARGRLAEFSTVVFDAHQEQRANMVLSLFEEIRARGFSQAQVVRLQALLERAAQAFEPVQNETNAVLERVRALNNTFKK